MASLDPRLLYRCLCAMMGNWPRLVDTDGITVDALFIWGRARGEWQYTQYDDGVLKCAADLFKWKPCPVVIPSYKGENFSQGNTGYAGPDEWMPILARRGIPPSRVIPVPGEGHNTKTEMDDFLRLAAQRGWKKIIVVAQPAHVLRAMLGTVRSLQNLRTLSEFHTEIRVYPFWPNRFDFKAESYGSQGKGPLPRLDWIDEEYNRIPKYQAQGDLASLEELWEYLKLLYEAL